jgi:hypothetical protein
MKKQFNFVNIACNAFNTIAEELMDREYEVNVSAAAAAALHCRTTKDVSGREWRSTKSVDMLFLHPTRV